MFTFAIASALTGCDLRPAPKSVPPSPQAAATDAGPTTPPPSRDVTPQCLNVATHVAQVLIDSANEPSRRETFEQARSNVVRGMAEACMTQHWSSEVQQCYLASKTEAEARACETAFAPPPAGPPPAKGD